MPGGFRAGREKAMSFKMTVEIETFGDECATVCPFLRYSECAFFGKKLRSAAGWYGKWLRCADCKEAEKAAEKADA